jgi:hypothetical protein
MLTNESCRLLSSARVAAGAPLTLVRNRARRHAGGPKNAGGGRPDRASGALGLDVPPTLEGRPWANSSAYSSCPFAGIWLT